MNKRILVLTDLVAALVLISIASCKTISDMMFVDPEQLAEAEQEEREFDPPRNIGGRS